MNATISVVCYQSKTLKNGEHPLMLRITKDRKRKFQILGISVNPNHWDFIKNRPKANCPNRDLIQNKSRSETSIDHSGEIFINYKQQHHIFLLNLSQFQVKIVWKDIFNKRCY